MNAQFAILIPTLNHLDGAACCQMRTCLKTRRPGPGRDKPPWVRAFRLFVLSRANLLCGVVSTSGGRWFSGLALPTPPLVPIVPGLIWDSSLCSSLWKTPFASLLGPTFFDRGAMSGRSVSISSKSVSAIRSISRGGPSSFELRRRGPTRRSSSNTPSPGDVPPRPSRWRSSTCGQPTKHNRSQACPPMSQRSHLR